jgi:putative peptidoglycan lipid II flippase
VLRLFTPRVVGLAAFQAMLFVTLFLAARIQEGRAVTAINYSWPILQFPVGALGLAAGTAIFPTLARLSTAEDMAAVRRTVNRSLRMCLFLALPATVGLVILGNQVVSVLYAHGTAWTDAGTANTAFALQFFSLALAPLASIEILARVFYAMRDTLTPVRIAIVAVAIDAGLSVLFVHLAPESSGQGALALATAVATAVQVIWLGRAADAKLGGLGTTSLRGTLLDSALASAAMGIVLFDLLALLTAILPQRGLGVIVTLMIELPVGAGVFALVCYLRGAPELWELHGLVQRK